ncbi:MAG: MlaD family protein [Deferrisomatales bacterium]
MSPEAKVGLLVLAGLLLLVYMSFKVGKIGLGPGGGYTVSLELDNAVGLTKDGEVLVAGIPVGRVEEIRLRNGRALVVLRLRGDVELPIDSTGNVRTQGVLGEKYVEIQPGTSRQALEEGSVLPAGPPPGDLDRLVTNLNEAAADIQRVTGRLANVLGTQEGEDSFRDLLEGLRDTAVSLREVVAENREALKASLDTVAALSGDLRDLVARNRANIDESLERVRDLTETLAEHTPGIARNLEALTGDLALVVSESREDFQVGVANLRVASAELAQTLGSLNRAEGTLGKLIHDDSLHRDLDAALGDVRDVLGRLERGEGTLGKLLTDETAYAELSESLGSLRSIADKIDRGEGTLGRLVNEESLHHNLNQTLEGITDFVAGTNRFQFELGYSGEYLAKLGEGKHTFGLEIRPRPDRFYYVGLVDDPRGDEETKVTERVISDEGGTRTVREEETVTRDRFKFSAQVGKRFSLLTVRGGILESSGGVGADLDLLSDRLRLTFEAFDFARDEGPPHLKLAARWTVLKHLFVTAGLDDFIDNKGRADYFVGGGIRFLDDDIKYLLSPAASAAQ